MPANPIVTSLAMIFALAAPLQAVPGEILIWTNVSRSTEVRAKFVSMDDANIILTLENGTTRPVPVTWFSQQSIEQAKKARKEAGGQATFIRIPHGTFTMGSPVKEPGRIYNPDPPPANVATAPTTAIPEYEPEHQVTLTRDFWLKATEVTWEEWNLVRDFGNKNGSDISLGQCGYGANAANNHPVTCITWLDAVKWCNAKSKMEGRPQAYFTHPDCSLDHILVSGETLVHVNWDSSGYRLPTEAEWEYACRERRSSGGQAFYSGPISSIDTDLPDRCLEPVGWYVANSEGTTHPVATRKANSLGLFDMHGNVSEWCWDVAEYLEAKEAKDPTGRVADGRHFYRGGSWADPARCCRSAYRPYNSPAAPLSPVVGFRLACGADPEKAPSPVPSGSPAKTRKLPGKK